MTLSALDRPIQFVKGVGPVRAEHLGRLGLLTARDLLYHVPRRYDDASTIVPIESLKVGGEANVVGTVRSCGVIPTRSGLRIFQAVLEDASGMITCSWPGQPWLERRVREGDRLLVTGPVKFFHGRQIQPREFTVVARGGEGDEDPSRTSGTIFPTYPAGEKVPQWILRRILSKNLDRLLQEVAREEYLDDAELERLGLPSLPSALKQLHRPDAMEEVETGRRRLAWDELFFLQLIQAKVRHRNTVEEPGIAFSRTNELLRPLHDSLPFRLTEAQTRVLKEIMDDMTSPRRMNRLLQGDVGSGKTVVALFAMLLAVEGGRQAALMAPTEILAEQHARTLEELLDPLGVSTVLLTGRLSSGERRQRLEDLESGRVELVVGTHALIQEEVRFAHLGLVVVDEQHRFGVRQRMALTEGSPRPDILIMSATPIPRSMALALYGDLDLSILDQRPPGRKAVRTVIHPTSQRDRVYRLVEGELEKGRQAYVIYPQVEESGDTELRAATEEHERLAREVFPHRRLGLVHGQLPSEEKDRVMRAFLDGEVDVLVATTVVEVGIDVPNATVMVVEHPERFGLSQLHQLRGRVGRGAEESWCVLVSNPGEEARERLRVFRESDDGFEVARADLRIRGQGDLFGDQQHGRDPTLRFADLGRDDDLLVEAQRLARAVVDRDPELELPEHDRIRHLLTTRHAERMELWKVG